MSGKRGRVRSAFGKEEDEHNSKRTRYDSHSSCFMGETTAIKKSRIYNYGGNVKPAQLFRKDLISSMKLPDSEQLSSDEYLLIADTWKEEWEKGVQVPVNPDALPDACFSINENKQKDDVINVSATTFKQSKKLLKCTIDSDSYLSKYELDLIDICWLKSLKESDDNVIIPDTIMEEIINDLEQQCAVNMKSKQIGIEYDDHIICDVCRSPDGEDGNEMVFCDSCNICVHQACYGITTIPEGDWLCKPCKEFGSQANISCVLCPNLGGAFKPTSTTNQWAHVSCALWVPEVSIGCVNTMEPITKIKQIPSTRWNLVCQICNVKKGAPIQCSVKSCKVAYHVTCAFNGKLKMKAIVEDDDKSVKLKSYCQKHLDYIENEKNNDTTESSNHYAKVNSKSQKELEISTVQANPECDSEFWKYVDISKIYHKFTPIIQNECGNVNLQNVQFYIDLIHQYWKLKRSSNYGIPLVKIITSASIEEMQLQERMAILRLRVDLERIRNLSYMLCRREKIKRNWLQVHRATLEKAIYYSTGAVFNNASQSVEFKPVHLSEERTKLAIDIVNANVIYNNEEIADSKSQMESDKMKTKMIIKKLKDLLKQERLKKLHSNPYAKFYMTKKKTDADEDENESSEKSSNSDKLTNQFLISRPQNHHHQHQQHQSNQQPQQQHHYKTPQKLQNHSHHQQQQHSPFHHNGSFNKSCHNRNGISPSKPLVTKQIANGASRSLFRNGSKTSLNSNSSTSSTSSSPISLTNSKSSSSILSLSPLRKDRCNNNNDLFNTHNNFKQNLSNEMIVTRSTALMNYKIPKKKRDTDDLNDNQPSSKTSTPEKFNESNKNRFDLNRKSLISHGRESRSSSSADYFSNQALKNNFSQTTFTNRGRLNNDDEALLASAAHDVDMRQQTVFR